MDFWLYRDARANKLQNDSTELANVIVRKNADIALYKQNEYDLKQANKNQLAITGEFKKEKEALAIKYDKAQTKVKRRGGIIIGSVSVNILLILAGVLILK